MISRNLHTAKPVSAPPLNAAALPYYLKAMGIRVMTTANNHTMDGGNEGMFMTNRLLDEARITHAGSGKDLTEARKAQVGVTPKGTIGVVGMYSIDPSSNPGPTRYSDARDKWPGLNPLHVTPYNVVTVEQMASLRNIRDASYAHRSEVTVPVAPAPANESPKGQADLLRRGELKLVQEASGKP